MKIPKDVNETIRDALIAQGDEFLEAVERFGDYTPEDIAKVEADQRAAFAWLATLEIDE